MPVDPQAQLILDLMVELSPFNDLGDDHRPIRALMEAGSGTDDEPFPMHAVEDHTVPGPAGDIAVRVYWPEPSMTDAPGVVYFHGGGWVVCSLETHDAVCRKMAARTGAVFVSVDYRLAPEHRFPAAPDDCFAATQWVAANGARWGIDTTCLAVAGDSAGGNLAAIAAVRARDAGLDLAAQLLVYPCTDLDPSRWPSMTENADGYFLTRDAMEWFYERYVTDADRTNPEAAPIHAPDLANVAPAFVLTAEFDPLRDEGRAYADRLRDAGVATEDTCYPGMIHGFFNMDDAIDLAKTAQNDAASFLTSAFGRATASSG
ncbi:MAG: alpha/beta hydrolase [Acidimicrobiales bacterium]|nr:alpha/beta hydrolase [Acidimicrobiales bacterium]